MGVNLLTDQGIIAIAQNRWPQVNKRTSIVPTKAKKLIVPIYEEDGRAVWNEEQDILERWLPGVDELPRYGQVTIELEPIDDIVGIVAMGYDAEVNMLAVTLSR